MIAIVSGSIILYNPLDIGAVDGQRCSAQLFDQRSRLSLLDPEGRFWFSELLGDDAVDALDDLNLLLRVFDAVDDVDTLDMLLLRGVDVAAEAGAVELREEVEARRSFLETRFTDPGFRQEPMRICSLSPIVYQLERPADADDFTFRKS